MKAPILCALIALVLWANSLVVVAGDGRLLARLDEAKDRHAGAQRALRPMERDLLFLADFEPDGAATFAGAALPLPLPMDHYRPGKFGRGFYFEKPRHNMLPPGMADVEADTSGFRTLEGAHLASVPCHGDGGSPEVRPPRGPSTRADSPQLEGEAAASRKGFGTRALSAMLSTSNAGFQSVPVKVTCRGLSWHEKEWTLLASAYVRGPKDARIRIEVAFVPAALPPSIQGDTNQPPRIADKAVVQEIVLTGTWQRVACTVSSDGRLKDREAVFSIRSEGPDPMTVLADGFQFEQAGYYPHHHNMPTTWLPGGRSAPATSMPIGSPLKETFPVAEGSMAFWTMTPRESNLRGPGGTFWISYGAGWAPQWAMSTYCFTGGGAGVAYGAAAGTDDGRWHHVAMTWDATNAYAYKDGKLVSRFEHKEREKPKQIETYSLMLGGSVSDGQAANSVMDDVAIFKRRLSDGEIQSLASNAIPLRATTEPFSLARSTRTVFYRDEEQAVLEFPAAAAPDIDLTCPLDAAVGDTLTARTKLVIRGGQGRAAVPFSPARLKCGDYLCRAAARPAEDAPVYIEFPIRIAPALRRDLYWIMNWGGGEGTAASRAYLRKLGCNAIDSYGLNIEEMGAAGFLYNWHLNLGACKTWTPEDRREVPATAAREAAWRARYPNWAGVLINSEMCSYLPNAEERARWFDAWAEKELGFPVPTNGWAMGTCNNPVQCWFPAGEKPASNGVYRTPPRTFQFLQWWYNRGMGQWRINAEIAAEVKKVRPDVTTWTDPLSAPGQVADLDAASSWLYANSGDTCSLGFRETLANLPDRKPFFGTFGIYDSPRYAVEVPGLGKRALGMTADDFIQQAWITTAGLAMHGLHFFAVTFDEPSASDSQGQYYHPGSLDKAGPVIRDDILPIGTMLRGVPNARNPMAVLMPESTAWMDNGEGGWGWGTCHYGNLWKGWVGRSGIPCDVLSDHRITPGVLARYKVVIFPMAQFASQTIHDELVAAGTSGTRVIVDGHCRQHYPNMQRWDQTYQLPPSRWSQTNYNQVVERPLAALAQELVPGLEAHAVGAEGPVLTFVREADGVKYIVVVNNLRQPGPYTEWTRNPDFKPYGKGQAATLYLKAPQDCALYEFTESRRLQARPEGDRLAVSLNLPPHAGRVVCVYPVAMAEIRVAPARSYRRGHPAVIRIRALDASGKPMPGRQLIRATIRDPQGNEHDESGIYRVTAGQAEIPFRPALNDPAGEWTVEAVERTSGLRASANFGVSR